MEFTAYKLIRIDVERQPTKAGRRKHVTEKETKIELTDLSQKKSDFLIPFG